ncbi:hypothetical protein OMAG_000553 [Candidatus Omnitrophus magneticus]|uniref:NYN domain-containing protein n=1 Tax=Candidatus Omnitrophus magneticus TaxID=1609969 RepID=A0A0F0CQH6_9BACT|nr:hypothetical protein OMAG_000553 [Candidatus Omnitrophus magneticus]
MSKRSFPVKDKFSVTKAFLFIGFVESNQNLYDSLKSDGFILIFKPTLRFKNGKVKGNVDTELVLHAMIEYENYNKTVIVTGDGDFSCLVKYLMEKDKLWRLLVPSRKSCSSLLAKLQPKIVYVDNLKDKLEYKHK